MPVTVMNERTYSELLLQGYLETNSRKTFHRASAGRSVTLTRQMSTTERVARFGGSILLAPFCCIFTTLTCAQVDCCYNLCAGELLAGSLDGCFTENGYIKDDKETKNLRDEDFQSLGYDDFSTKNVVQLAKSQKFPTIQSDQFPQQAYIAFYGPHTKFSYIIVIPNLDPDNAIFYPVFNSEGKPCNTVEAAKKAEILCGGYKSGAHKVSLVHEKTLLRTTKVDTVYGTFEGREYGHGERIRTE